MRRGLAQIHIILIVVAVVVAFLAFPGGPFYSVLFSASDSGDVFAEGDGGSVLSGGNQDPCLTRPSCGGSCVFGSISNGLCVRNLQNGVCACTAVSGSDPSPTLCDPFMCLPDACIVPGTNQLGRCAWDSARVCVCDAGVISPGQPGKTTPAPPGPVSPVMNLVYKWLAVSYANNRGVVGERLDYNKLPNDYLNWPFLLTSGVDGSPRIFYQFHVRSGNDATVTFKTAVRDSAGNWNEDVIDSLFVKSYFGFPHSANYYRSPFAAFSEQYGRPRSLAVFYGFSESIDNLRRFHGVDRLAEHRISMALPAASLGKGTCQGSLASKNWDCVDVYVKMTEEFPYSIFVSASARDSKGNFYLVTTEGDTLGGGKNELYVYKVSPTGVLISRELLLSNTGIYSTPRVAQYKVLDLAIDPASDSAIVLLQKDMGVGGTLRNTLLVASVANSPGDSLCPRSAIWYCSLELTTSNLIRSNEGRIVYAKGQRVIYAFEYVQNPVNKNLKIVRIVGQNPPQDTGLTVNIDYLGPGNYPTFYVLVDSNGNTRIAVLEYTGGSSGSGYSEVFLADAVPLGNGNCGKLNDYSCQIIKLDYPSANLVASVG